MKSKTLASIAAGMGLLSLTCGSQPPAPANNSQPPAASSVASPAATSDQFAAGRANYAKYCAECHQPTGEGGVVQHEELRLKVPSLKEGHAVTHSDQQLVKQVLNGGDGMPAFKNKLSTADAAELVNFVRHEFQGK